MQSPWEVVRRFVKPNHVFVVATKQNQCKYDNKVNKMAIIESIIIIIVVKIISQSL